MTAAKLLAARSEAKLSRAALAKLSGVSEPTIYRLEHGQGSLDAALKVWVALGKDPAELLREVMPSEQVRKTVP